MVMLDRRISLLPMLIFVTADLVSTKMAMRRPVRDKEDATGTHIGMMVGAQVVLVLTVADIMLLNVISVLFMALFPFLVANTANTNKSIFLDNFDLCLTILGEFAVVTVVKL